MNPQFIDTKTSVDFAFWYIGIISVALLAAVTIAMVYFCIRYHKSRNPKPTSDAHGSMWLELIWTLIPTLIVMSMFWYGWAGYIGLRNIPDDALQIKASAYMWGWTFIYEDGRKTDKLYVPTGKPIRLNIVAQDVLHGVFIPAFRVKKDAIPGRETRLWFNAKDEGSYDLFCTEYCGLGHSSMITTVEAMSPEAFAKWLAEAPAQKAELPGEAVMNKYACLGCHSIDGTPRSGPTFKGIWQRDRVVLVNGREQTVPTDVGYLSRSILQPNAEIVKGYPGVMPVYEGRVTEDELNELLNYLEKMR